MMGWAIVSEVSQADVYYIYILYEIYGCLRASQRALVAVEGA